MRKLIAMDMNTGVVADVESRGPNSSRTQLAVAEGDSLYVADANSEYYPNETRYTVSQQDLENYLSNGAVMIVDEIKDTFNDGVTIVSEITDAQNDAVTEAQDTANTVAPGLMQKFQELPSAGKLGVAAAGYLGMKMVPKQYLFGGLALFLFLKMKKKQTENQGIAVGEQTSSDVSGMC